MSKKKKKNTNNIGLLYNIDKNLDKKYSDTLSEIEGYRWELLRADKKAKKIARKKVKENPKFYDFEKVRCETRFKIVNEMEGSSFLQRILNLISDLTPVVVLISRLVASIILAILAIPQVKMRIKPGTLDMMQNVYKHCMAVQGV